MRSTTTIKCATIFYGFLSSQLTCRSNIVMPLWFSTLRFVPANWRWSLKIDSLSSVPLIEFSYNVRHEKMSQTCCCVVVYVLCTSAKRPGLNEWNEISWWSIITGHRFVFVSHSNPNKFLIIWSGLKVFGNYVECFCVFPHHDLRTHPIHKDRSRKREITKI